MRGAAPRSRRSCRSRCSPSRCGGRSESWRSASAADPESTMRILAWPAFKAGAQNPYNRLLYRAMVESSRKLNVEDFSLKTFWCGPFDVWHIHWPQRHSAQRSLVKAFASTAVLALLVVAARLD